MQQTECKINCTFFNEQKIKIKKSVKCVSFLQKGQKHKTVCSMSASTADDQQMAEIYFLRHYILALAKQDAIALQAVMWGLPLLMVNPSQMFVSQLAIAGGNITPRDALCLADPDYAANPAYAIVGTAVDSVMSIRASTLDKCIILQERLHSTDDLDNRK